MRFYEIVYSDPSKPGLDFIHELYDPKADFIGYFSVREAIARVILYSEDYEEEEIIDLLLKNGLKREYLALDD